MKRRSRASAPRRIRRHYRRPSFHRWFRRHKPKKIPILPIAGAAVSFTQMSSSANSPQANWGSPMSALESGDMRYFIQSLVNNYTGVGLPIAGGYTSGPILFDPMRLINVFDLNYAPGFKYTFWGGVGSMACKWFGITRRVQPYMNKIPIIKKFTL